MKCCSLCGEYKPLTEFHRQCTAFDGYRSHCKPCRRSETQANHIRNRDRINKRSAAWRRDNREQFLADMREWRLKHVDRLRELNRSYREKNKERIREQYALPRRREYARQNAKVQRAIRMGIVASGHEMISARQWQDVQDSYMGLCAYCHIRPEVLTMDHVVPLRGGGTHSADNVLPACKSCNCSKGPKSLLIFLLHRQKKVAA